MGDQQPGGEQKKQGYYRSICPECLEKVDVPLKDVKEANNVGAGRDYDGSYDSGYSQTTLVCNICDSINKYNGTIQEQIKEKRLFKVFK